MFLFIITLLAGSVDIKSLPGVFVSRYGFFGTAILFGAAFVFDILTFGSLVKYLFFS